MARDVTLTEELRIVLDPSLRGQSSSEQPATTSQGRKSTFRNGARPRGKTGENIAQYNFKSIAQIGLAIRGFRMGNELLGAYSGNRLRQRRVNTSMLFGSYMIGIAKFGAFGAAYAGIDLAYRTTMHNIEVGKNDRQSQILENKSGNNRTNMGRNRGVYL